MFKKQPILTATICEKLEMMRSALGVLTGQRVRFINFDFNTYRGRISFGGAEVNFYGQFIRTNLLSMRIGGDRWYTAVLSPDGEIRVNDDFFKYTRSTIIGYIDICCIGTDETNRREEPLFLKEVLQSAKARGMTLQELLDSKPEAS